MLRNSSNASHKEKTANLVNEKLIVLVQQYTELHLPQPENLLRCHVKSWCMEGN